MSGESQPGAERPPAVVKTGAVALALAALGVGVWVRISRFDGVFAEGTVLPLTGDATYHLRRSLLTFRRFPHVPVRDPLMGWPHGADCHWTNGFDLVSAALARVLAPGGDDYSAAAVIMIVPVLLGLVCAGLTAACAYRLLEDHDEGAGAAQLAGWLCLLLPIGVLTSLLGRSDHHVAEALCIAALCLWLLGRLPSAVFDARPRARRWGFELSGGMLIAGSMYLFSGSLIYLAVVAAPLMAVGLFAGPSARPPLARIAGSGAPAFGLGALLTFVLYAPNVRAHGQRVSYVFPSWLQPGMLLLIAVWLGAVWLVSVGVARGDARFPWRRAAVIAAAGTALAGMALASPLGGPLQTAVEQHLLRGEAWIAQTAEVQPLLRWSTLWTAAGWREALKYFGPFAPATPLLLPLAIAEVRHSGQAQRAASFGWLAGCLLLLTLLQQRFARPLWPLVAIWTALGLIGLARRTLRERGGARASLLVALVLAVLGLGASDVLRGRLVREHESPSAGALASVFLARANAPRADATRAGVLTSWSLGHNMIWPAASGVVANGFGVYADREGYAAVERALGADEPVALGLMQRRDLGWLVIGASYYGLARVGPTRLAPTVRGPDGRGVLDPIFLKSVPLGVSMLGGSAWPEASVPHLQQLVPRWASAAAMPGMAFYLPELWAYERVAGARWVGTTRPFGRVVGQVELRVRGVLLPYRAYADADARGAFTLRVPIWNGLLGAGVEAAPRWSVHVPDHAPILQIVAESDVRKGRTLTLPVAPAPPRAREAAADR